MYVLAYPIKDLHYQETYFYRMKDNKPQIFTFNNQKEANACLGMFQQFAINEIMKQSNHFFDTIEVLQMISGWTLKEIPEGVTCELISFKELMKEKGINI